MIERKTIVLRCKVCGVDCARTDYAPHKWVHMDDEFKMKGEAVTSYGKYDHHADPDFIDVTPVSQEGVTNEQPDSQQKGWTDIWGPRRRS